MPKFISDHIFWQLPCLPTKACHNNIETEVAIVGGGMAGLFAAYHAHRQGKKVALFEQHYCGSGATGKSGGFITSNAELYFTDFIQRFGFQEAQSIWQNIDHGAEQIQSVIKEQQFSCNMQKQDTLVLATYAHDLKKLHKEHRALNKASFKTNFLNKQEVQTNINSDNFFGALCYENTFNINAFSFCQEMKNFLQQQGVLIFEETPITSLQKNQLITSYHNKITYKKAIVCVDRFLPKLHKLENDVYHAQTFILMSAPLTPEQIATIFPQKPYMAWDTELIYNYFRLTDDNRLLLGGGDMFSTYASEKHNYQRIVKKLTSYLAKTFKQSNIQFEYMWPGLIGISKDIGPIAGPDKDDNNIYYVTACTGLAIAASLGHYAVQHIFENRTDLDRFFDPYRKFPVSGLAQKIIGKKASFALSNVIKQNIP